MKPWQEKLDCSRGAPMGRGGADPRAVWPYGVLSLREACDQYGEAMGDLRKHDSAVTRDNAAQARARLEAVERGTSATPTLILEEVPLDEGYDEGGAYWGDGEPLFCAYSENRAWVIYARAANRAAFVKAMRPEYPTTDFRHARPDE